MTSPSTERIGSMLEVVILLIVAVTSAVNIWLTLTYRSAWHHAANGEYQLCLQRETYDHRMHVLEQADANLMKAMIAADEANPVFQDGIRLARDKAFKAKLSVDENYLATPVVDGCELVRP